MTADIPKLIATQTELCALIGVPGYEDAVADYLVPRLQDIAADVWKDPLGSVVSVQPGSDPDPITIMLDAHMDEVGFMINHIDQQGFLRIAPMGTIDRALMPGTVLAFSDKEGKPVNGVVGSLPPHVTRPDERGQAPDFPQLYVDIGARDGQEVNDLGLGIGSIGTFATPLLNRGDEVLIGRGFDDRTACNVLLQVMTQLKTESIGATVVGLFSVQEEVGGRGAAAAAATLQPDVAMALENTTATDSPGVPPQAVVCRTGAGPVLTIADRSLLVPPRLLRKLEQAGDRAEVPYQYKRPPFGSTDGGPIATAGGGIPACVVSVPCRYIHGPAGLLRVQDIVDTIDLVVEFCRLDWSDWERRRRGRLRTFLKPG